MKTYTFFIPVKPVGKARPRFVVRHGKGHAYSVSETDEGKIIIYLNQQWVGRPLITEAVKITAIYVFARPKGHYGTGRNSSKLKASSPVMYTKKPDIDNIDKILLDSLNGIILKDDAQVIAMDSTKRYAGDNEQEHIEFKLEVIEDA